jgi:hypothetical protein
VRSGLRKCVGRDNGATNTDEDDDAGRHIRRQGMCACMMGTMAAGKTWSDGRGRGSGGTGNNGQG